MRIVEHWLSGEGIFRQPTNKHSGRVEGPRIVVLHYTAGANALSSVAHLTDPAVRASAHVVIGRDGRIWQLLPFDLAAWHAGEGCYGGRRDVNRFSVGIELDNAGRLRRRDGRFFTAFGQEVPPDEVYAHQMPDRVTYWHRYTEVQTVRLKEILEVLLETYPTLADVAGHSDLTLRKQDPGPALGEWGIEDRQFFIKLPENKLFIHY